MTNKTDASKTPARWRGWGLLTKEQALQKLRHYCGYQERSHRDAVQKLFELGVQKTKHEILSLLIEEGYLNEERFALLYTGSKFRINDWGKKKILNGLKVKQVSSYIINKALKTIDDNDYQKKLQELAQKKYKLLKGEQSLVRKKKTINYLLQKGYEPQLITQVLAQIKEKNPY